MGQAHQYYNRDNNYPETPFYGYNSQENLMVNSAERLEKDFNVRDRREKTARVFRIIIAVLIFVIFVQVVYHLYFARNVKISKVQIETGTNFSATDEQILEMAGLGRTESYFALDTNLVEARLQRYSQVSSAVVEKKFPDTLKIRIEGRTPLAICLIETSDRVIPAVVDSKGVVFQLGKSVTNMNLPVISGIRIEDARLGIRMPDALNSFLSGLNSLKTESPAFFNSISELRVVRKNNDDFELLMYPQNYSIPVRLGSRIDKELFTYVLLVLDVASRQGMSEYLEELDFRTDEVVYKLREE